MARVMLSPTTFENLVKHLIEVEEGKGKLIEQYFPKPSKERNEFEKLIEDYIKQIEQLIKDVNKSQSAGDKVPFVTIGSEVEVEDLSEQPPNIFKYRIVSPFYDSVKEGTVSYLSPVGKALLLKRVGDEVEVKAPGGVFRYRIRSIRLPDDD